jgi:hypothetical protein
MWYYAIVFSHIKIVSIPAYVRKLFYCDIVQHNTVIFTN